MTPADLRCRHPGETALVLGNGKSRLDIDVNAVMLHGKAWTIGCNAIVRDIPDIDYVVAVDIKPVREWERRGVVGPVYVGYSPSVAYEKLHVGSEPVLAWSPWGKDRPGILSGIYAVLLAIELGCTEVILAGFDMDGYTLYQGTECYNRHPVANAHEDQPARMEGVVKRRCRELKQNLDLSQIGANTIPIARPREMPELWRSRNATTLSPLG